MHNRHGLVDTGLISVYNRGWGFIPSLLGCTIWNVEYFSSIISVWGAANILVVIGRELRCEIKKTHQWSSTFCFMSNYFDSKLAAKLQNRIVAFSMRFVQSLCVKDGSCRNGLIQLELLLWTRCWHITFHSLGAPVKITLSRLKQLLPFVLNQAEGEFLSQRNSHLMELLPIQSLALLEQLDDATWAWYFLRWCNTFSTYHSSGFQPTYIWTRDSCIRLFQLFTWGISLPTVSLS